MTEFLTVKEVAGIMRKTTRTIYEWINTGAIPFTTPKGTNVKLIRRDRFEAWLKSGDHDPLSKRL